MQVDIVAAPERESLRDIEEALDRMTVRRQAILSEPALTQQTLVELTAIFNNVAYVFLYLEANDEHVKYERLLPWRDAFYKNSELDRRTLDLLSMLRCSDADAERSRRAYVEQLQEKLRPPDPAGGVRMQQLLAEAKSVLDGIRQDHARMLARIGLRMPVRNPSASFYKVISSTHDAMSRTKLARAWTSVRDANRAKLISLVDQMIDTRHDLAAAEFHDSVMERTLKKCRAGEADIATFLDEYLVQAMDGHALLEAEIRDATSVPDNPLDHFGFYMRSAFGEQKAPLFLLEDCLDYIFTVASAVFGLVLQRTRSDKERVAAAVWAGGGEVGEINFDLWDTEAKTGGANHTKGIRNRSDWKGLTQRPVAYVSCRFMRGRDGANRITFQNVHSLFHEFGHAINHLLIRERIPNQSGLEYLPLERLEYLSMWFEKWVYHPAFGLHLRLSEQEHEGLKLCQRVKMLEYRRTYVERAVTAYLDFDLHRRGGRGMEASFRELDEKFGIARFCALGDFPAYFTWPMFHAYPGANFVYLWGAAASCEKFLPFQNHTLDEVVRRPGLQELLASCFHFDMPSASPASAAVFAFYEPRSGQAFAARPIPATEQ